MFCIYFYIIIHSLKVNQMYNLISWVTIIRLVLINKEKLIPRKMIKQWKWQFSPTVLHCKFYSFCRKEKTWSFYIAKTNFSYVLCSVGQMRCRTTDMSDTNDTQISKPCFVGILRCRTGEMSDNCATLIRSTVHS